MVLADTVSSYYTVIKINRCTGLQQCTGRAKRVTPSVAWPFFPLRHARGARRSRRRNKTCAFSVNFPSQSGHNIALAGSGCGHRGPPHYFPFRSTTMEVSTNFYGSFHGSKFTSMESVEDDILPSTVHGSWWTYIYFDGSE